MDNDEEPKVKIPDELRGYTYSEEENIWFFDGLPSDPPKGCNQCPFLLDRVSCAHADCFLS